MLSLIQKLDLRYHIKSHLDDKEKAKPKGKGCTILFETKFPLLFFHLFIHFLIDEEGEEEGVVEPTQDPLLSAMAERQRDVEVIHLIFFPLISFELFSKILLN